MHGFVDAARAQQTTHAITKTARMTLAYRNFIGLPVGAKEGHYCLKILASTPIQSTSGWIYA